VMEISTAWSGPHPSVTWSTS